MAHNVTSFASHAHNTNTKWPADSLSRSLTWSFTHRQLNDWMTDANVEQQQHSSNLHKSKVCSLWNTHALCSSVLSRGAFCPSVLQHPAADRVFAVQTPICSLRTPSCVRLQWCSQQWCATGYRQCCVKRTRFSSGICVHSEIVAHGASRYSRLQANYKIARQKWYQCWWQLYWELIIFSARPKD